MRVAALVRGIVRVRGSAAIVGVVSRRAVAQEFEPVGVVVRVQQAGELRGRVDRLTDFATPKTNRNAIGLDSAAGGIVMRSAMPAASAASKSTIHFMPGSIL